MSVNLSPELLAQLYKQESNDPFLTLITLSHSTFASDILLVNNTEDIISNGKTFKAFPVSIILPADDGETAREVSLTMDNVSLEIIEPLRSVTSYIGVKLEMVLASIPDDIQMSFEELKIGTISYNSKTISAKLFADDFLNAAIGGETYGPTNFPGLF